MTKRSVILVVDDSATACEVLRGILDATRYDVVTATCGQDGIAKAVSRRPDLVLLDVMMPGIDGFEACRRMRKIEQLREVPIVMMTALHDSDTKRLAVAAGTRLVIEKPFNRAELRAYIDAAIGRDDSTSTPSMV